ncbi:AtzH-like domain-containing protein [Herbiconiux ginsengi]|uniref:Amidase n=1 Tax=Herbiconiux ginsengi TaxID=381665 RepID=A0A1H3S062_9MICO|nr:AtzH-like domain-containing protein [Herbiconiux ginsengi]SDZ31332.1 amidase [Herbiconiux ginsengi]
MPDQWNAFVHGPSLMVPPTGPGSLDGLSFGVKDIIDVRGLPTGCGLEFSGPAAERSGHAVAALLHAGASCVGKTTTDQFAFSLSGADTATRHPINPRDPSRLVGGSSSGSAAAVAAGLVPFALSTDTAGSVRVPASYCRVVGFRPSWGAVPLTGVTPLAPRFDTLGWHARDVRTAARVGAVLLPEEPESAPSVLRSALLVDEVMSALDPGLAASVLEATAALGREHGWATHRLRLGISLREIGRAFRQLQLQDIAATPRDSAGLDAALPRVRERFAGAVASRVEPELISRVEAAVLDLLAALEEGAVLVLPAAGGPAPTRDDIDSDAYAAHRDLSIALNALAGLLGAPCLVRPQKESEVGIAYVSAPGTDRMLLRTLSEGEVAPLPHHDALLTEFYRYERALTCGDLDTLDALFAASSPCIRFAPEGAAYDRSSIAALRTAQTRPATPREFLHVSVESLSDEIAITALRFRRVPSGVCGYQTQTWQRDPDGWRIRMAHVSITDSAG